MFKLSLLFIVVFMTAYSIGMPASVEDEYDTVVVGGDEENVSGEIDNTLTRPNPSEICRMPALIGHCRASMLRWNYDPRKKECVKFFYGGCSGNANNFKTKALCLRFCTGI